MYTSARYPGEHRVTLLDITFTCTGAPVLRHAASQKNLMALDGDAIGYYQQQLDDALCIQHSASCQQELNDNINLWALNKQWKNCA